MCETRYKIWMHGNEIVTLLRNLSPGREEPWLMLRFFEKIKKEGKTPLPSWYPKRACSFSLSRAMFQTKCKWPLTNPVSLQKGGINKKFDVSRQRSPDAERKKQSKVLLKNQTRRRCCFLLKIAKKASKGMYCLAEKRGRTKFDWRLAEKRVAQNSTGLCLAEKRREKSFGGWASCWKWRKRLSGQRHVVSCWKKCFDRSMSCWKTGRTKIGRSVSCWKIENVSTGLCVLLRKGAERVSMVECVSSENMSRKRLRQVFVLLKTKKKDRQICVFLKKSLSLSCWTKKKQKMSCRSDEKEGASVTECRTTES